MVLALVALFSFGYRLVERIHEEITNPISESRMGEWIRSAAREFSEFSRKDLGDPIVSTDWHKGLYFAYWTRRVYLGPMPLPGTRQEYEAVLRGVLNPGWALQPFGRVIVLAYEQPDYAPWGTVLGRLAGFGILGESSDAGSRWRLVELRFEGLPGPPRADGNQ
jgi:hypothetical protein